MLCVENLYVMGAETSDVEASGSDRGTIHPVTRHCTIEMILKLLF